MQINRDFTIQKVGTSWVAVPVGETSKHFHGMVRLNETGAFLWEQMAEKDCTEEELVEALLGEYDVSREVAARDVHRVVELLRENWILA
ncbi:MAG: PqqD family protein [Clostridia bacterium]|nr:PqqD family protein [Clostridia bacterium]MBQ9798280.1 PqqD family protein [Clostridia bacterium]